MSSERKSKRQERREKIQKQQSRSRLYMILGIVIIAVVVVILFVLPSLRPAIGVVSVDPGTHPNPNDNSMGDPKAPVKIEEFSDFQCPYCEQFHTNTEALLRQYYIDTGKVLFTYRSMGNWVSRNVGGTSTESQDAAQAAYCAGDQNKFWEMHALLFGNVKGEDVGSFTPKRLKLIAAKVPGLDMNQFNSCFDSGKFKDRVQQDLADGTAAGITGTPGFVMSYTVNGQTKTKLIEGAQPFSQFQQDIEAALNEMGVK